MRIYRATPKRTAAFAPGRDEIVLLRSDRAPKLAHPMEFVEDLWIDNAPIERLENRFVEAFKAKGWIK